MSRASRLRALEARAQALFPMARDRNPMVSKHGLATPAAKCRTCIHIVRHEAGRVWYKCRLRGDTSNAATDHGVTWNACGVYKENV